MVYHSHNTSHLAEMDRLSDEVHRLRKRTTELIGQVERNALALRQAHRRQIADSVLIAQRDSEILALRAEIEYLQENRQFLWSQRSKHVNSIINLRRQIAALEAEAA